MADQPKQINFTIVPDDTAATPRTYANFCSIAHTPFDFTLTFCEVMPLSDKEIKEAETEHVVRAPVRAKIVVPVQFVPNLIAALQEHWRVFSESYSNVGWNKGTGPDSLIATVAHEDATETRHILDLLEAQHPDADTELHYRERVPAARRRRSCRRSRPTSASTWSRRRCSSATRTRRRWRRRRRPSSSRRFTRPDSSAQKSKALIGMARRSSSEHGGEVPANMDALVELPGVGRKTANVVLGHALGVPGLPVDRHVLRVANRIGIAESDDPVVVEQQLCGALPPERWTRTSDTLILHGRRICKPKPLCDQCAVPAMCDYFTDPDNPGGPRVAARPRKAQKEASGESETPWIDARSKRLVADALAGIPRRFREAMTNLAIVVERRAVAASCSPRWRSSRPTRCSASTRARRSPSGVGLRQRAARSHPALSGAARARGRG